MPPFAEKPPTLPPAASTRWHGTTIAGTGFARALARRHAPRRGTPSRAAISPYESVPPPRNGTRELVDAAVERWYSIHVERDGGEIDRLAAEEPR